jgi:hypothetical protein
LSPIVIPATAAGAAATTSVVGIYAATERIKVSVAQGGASKTGTFRFIIA